MNELQLRARIRQLHETGEVPCDEVDGKLWAGSGTGSQCAICTDSIGPTETEFEIDVSSGARLRVHRRCYYLWLEECGSASA